MTMTITLTPEQEERLKALAAVRGIDFNEFATAVLLRALEEGEGEFLAPLPKPRPWGLAKGEFIVPDDFDAPLPESILADFEGHGSGVV